MFWVTLFVGVMMVMSAIELGERIPRPPRVALGLLGTALVIRAVFFL